MPISIRPVTDHFIAEFRGVDLSGPIAPAERDAIVAALHQHLVLIFPDQPLTPQQHIAFTREFGELYINEKAREKGFEFAELTMFGNLNPLGDTFTPPTKDRDLEEWHTDHCHRPVLALGSLVFARVVPREGGETWYADMHAAHDALPADLKRRIESVKAVHSGAALHDFRAAADPTIKPLSAEERAAIPEIVHPLIKTHPITGRNALYFGSKIIVRLVGMPEAEGKALVAELTAFATQDRFVYRHKWQANELIFWDNRSVLHTGTNYDKSRYTRYMQRTTILNNERAIA
jgi:taurine dioxygenase